MISPILFLTGLPLLLVNALAVASWASLQTEQSPLERDLDASDVHTYRVTLASGQFMRAAFEQRGIDLVVTLSGPASESLVARAHPLRRLQPHGHGYLRRKILLFDSALTSQTILCPPWHPPVPGRRAAASIIGPLSSLDDPDHLRPS